MRAIQEETFVVTIYLHQRKNGTEKRLIKTTHPSKAMAYVSKSEFTCEHADVETVVELMQKGVLIEDADTKAKTSDMFNGESSAPTYEQAGGE